MREATPLSLTALLLVASGCVSIELETENRACEVRLAYHPDADGDGVGADDTVYVGCEAPEGYVEGGGDCDDSDPSVTSCGDTGDTEPEDTGDTKPEDTGDTEPEDTGDTEPTDTGAPVQGA